MIAVFRAAGTARKTASRKPVRTSRKIRIPSRDDTHGLAVAEACPQDQGEGDDRVEAKACGQGQRIVGNDAHEDRHDARNQRGTGGDALGRNRTIRGDGVAQDSRVDNQDVSHREEGDDSTANLMTNGRAARGNLEERIE